MKIEFVIFIITAILIANTYYDGKLVKILHMVKNSKYLKMATFGFAGLSLYLFLKKNIITDNGKVEKKKELVKLFIQMVHNMMDNRIKIIKMKS
jgi:hypothetical protein